MRNFELVILGCGESGVGCALLAASKGISVFVSDKGMIAPPFADELRNAGIYFEQGSHSEDIILNAQKIIKSPGIPEKAEIIQKIRAAKIPIISELDFAQSHSHAKVIAITGTNGKTTTTSMIYELCKNAELDVKVGGNIGLSYARQVAEKDPEFFVLEVSSFQLDDSYDFHPYISILCNITPDHLDRYEYQLEKYIESKFKITQNQTNKDYFIYCADDTITLENLHKAGLSVKKIPFSYYKEQEEGAFIQNKVLTLLSKEKKIYMTMNIQNLSLSGIHNAYNSMATAITASILNIRKDVIRESLSNFENVEHRLEFVASVGGVSFINDSKATNVNSAWYALESTSNPVIWIAGGVDKGNDYEMLLPLVKEKVKLIICLGVDNSKIHSAFGKDVDLILNTTSMTEAVKTAYRFSEKGDTVLLSPACASFDLFLNYQDRGRAFKQEVKRL
jgi:UDP-N-acetylmuramoylalanine--D-glutamate ligase